MIFKNGKMKEINSRHHEKPNYVSTFLKPLIILKMNDSNYLFSDARLLNINTDQPSLSRPLEPLATQLAIANKKNKAANDLIFVYAHTTLDEKTFILTGFSPGDKLLAFIRSCHGLKGPSMFLRSKDDSLFQKFEMSRIRAALYS